MSDSPQFNASTIITFLTDNQIDSRKHIATAQNTRYNTHQSVRSSLSLSSEYRNREHRRSESLDTQIAGKQLSSHHQFKRRSHNYAMDPKDLLSNFNVEGLNLITSGNSNNSVTHDYAEIYTPSAEKTPSWMKTLASYGSSSPTSTSADYVTAKPPTPPLHRFPSWEAKIYEVAKDGLGGDDSDSQDQDISSNNVDSLTRTQQGAVIGGYCDINVPVYATGIQI